jgi:hypothetical protein
MQPNTSSWPAAPALDPEQAAALNRYEQLSREERARVRFLVATTGCTLSLAVAAVVATRPTE